MPCIHDGGTDPCPTCQDGCGRVTGLYLRSNKRDKQVAGRHKRFINGHQSNSRRDANLLQRAYLKRELAAAEKGRKLPEDKTDQEIMLNEMLNEALASGLTGDDMIRVFLGRKELLAAILMAHVKSALNGNVASTKLLLDRSLGTPKQGGKGVVKPVDLGFLNPLESVDELYADE